MPFEPTALLKQLDGDQLEALVDTMVLAADADGELDPAEVDALAANIATLAEGTKHAAQLAGEPLNQRITATRQRIAGGDRQGLIDSVKQRLADGEARQAALGLAITVTAADGIVRTSEREVILELAEALEIDRDVAADLVIDITRR
jgi:tellurite resistance protein